MEENDDDDDSNEEEATDGVNEIDDELILAKEIADNNQDDLFNVTSKFQGIAH